MVYFCADDYGISKQSNSRIENCIKNGVLNKVSVLPNGEIEDFKRCKAYTNVQLSLHLNLVEGYPLSKPQDVSLLVSEDGSFKYSFAGLFLLSLTSKRKKLEKQLYKEIQSQLDFWKAQIGEGTALFVDSHQHTHMIPIVFKTLMRVIKDQGLKVENVRIPSEPVLPYILTPSLYLSYPLSGLLKQWILKFLALVNRKELKKSKIPSTYFMGVVFSGKVTEKVIKKLLPQYLKLAEKNNKDVEIGLHPVYLESGEKPFPGSRKGFDKFYFSPWRKIEHDTLVNFKF